MPASPRFLLFPLAASLALAACGGSSSGSYSTATTASSATRASAPSPAGGSSAIVKPAANATLGTTVLTDASGMTLYSLSGEHNGRFICTSAACVGVWHPLSAASAGKPSGSVGSLATVKRPDGTEQVTSRGMPLYTFAGDRQPGDAKGQGLKDVGTWTAVTVGESSAPAASTASQATQSAPASSGGRYGY